MKLQPHVLSASARAAVVVFMVFHLESARAHSSPSAVGDIRALARIAVSTNDEANHIGRIYLGHNGIIKLLTSDPDGKYQLAFSPGGDKIAFIRVTPRDVADAELDVIDLNVKILSRTLINYNIKLDPTVPPNMNFVHVQGIGAVIWMGQNEDLVAVTGYLNPVANLGYIIPLQERPSGRPSLFPNMRSDKDTGFLDDGPLAVSPLRTHIVTVSGLVPSYRYPSCAATDEKLQIDGATIDSPGKMAFVAPFSWFDETRFSTVIRTERDFEILTVSNVAREFEFGPSDPDGDGGDLKNPPKLSFKPISLRPDEMAGASFVGHYGPDGKFILHQYTGNYSTKVTANLTLSGDKLTREPPERMQPESDDDLQAARELEGGFMSALRPRFTKSETVTSVDLWCHGAACGVLNRVLPETPSDPSRFRVPGVCLPTPR
jgi:hypothetical protein